MLWKRGGNGDHGHCGDRPSQCRSGQNPLYNKKGNQTKMQYKVELLVNHTHLVNCNSDAGNTQDPNPTEPVRASPSSPSKCSMRIVRSTKHPETPDLREIILRRGAERQWEALPHGAAENWPWCRCAQCAGPVRDAGSHCLISSGETRHVRPQRKSDGKPK